MMRCFTVVAKLLGSVCISCRPILIVRKCECIGPMNKPLYGSVKCSQVYPSADKRLHDVWPKSAIIQKAPDAQHRYPCHSGWNCTWMGWVLCCTGTVSSVCITMF